MQCVLCAYMFDAYVNVHGDYRLYATEFINYLSVIIASRVKKLLAETKVDQSYSYAQVFKYLSKYKMLDTRKSSEIRKVYNYPKNPVVTSI